jgi:hypothetical protein
LLSKQLQKVKSTENSQKNFLSLAFDSSQN